MPMENGGDISKTNVWNEHLSDIFSTIFPEKNIPGILREYFFALASLTAFGGSHSTKDDLPRKRK